jgi:hypothetical protein
LCENLEDQPVEYAGKVWDPEKCRFCPQLLHIRYYWILIIS